MPAFRSLIPVCARYSIPGALSPEGKRRNARPDHSSVVSGAPVKEGPAVARQLRNLPLLASYIWSSYVPVRSLSFLLSTLFRAPLANLRPTLLSLSPFLFIFFSLSADLLEAPSGRISSSSSSSIPFPDPYPHYAVPKRRRLRYAARRVALSRTTRSILEEYSPSA